MEQEFQRHLVDIPIYDRMGCNQTWFRKDVVETSLFSLEINEDEMKQ